MWYGRTFDLDPNALQLRLHVPVVRQRRPVEARLFQVPSSDQRHDSPLWQHVQCWLHDPERVGPLRSTDDALERLIVPLLQQRIPGIG